ncbi:MAG: hypothetical protein WBZ33_12625 [Thermoactinomyces sp.]
MLYPIKRGQHHCTKEEQCGTGHHTPDRRSLFLATFRERQDWQKSK